MRFRHLEGKGWNFVVGFYGGIEGGGEGEERRLLFTGEGESKRWNRRRWRERLFER